MIKKQIPFVVVAAHIILVFVGAMFYTFIGEYLQSSGFFADTKCISSCSGIDPFHDWGIRHYLYFWMSVSLFIVNVARVVVIVVNLIDKWDNP